MKRIAIAGAILAAAFVAAPMAANAATYPTPVPPGTTVSTGVGTPIAVGVDVPLSWVDGSANVVVDGPGSAVITPIVTSTGTATVYSGAAYFTITPSVVGSYTATLTQPGSPGSVSVIVSATQSTAYTGVSDPTPYVWLGGGLAVLGAAAVVTVIAVRRQNAKEHLSA